VNRQFHQSTAPERYATLFFAYTTTRRAAALRELRPQPAAAAPERRRLERLEPTAPVVGLLPDWRCDVAELALAKGDTLLVYSDGITDAENAADEPFGEARLLAALHGRPLARAVAAAGGDPRRRRALRGLGARGRPHADRRASALIVSRRWTRRT
jgi:serine phosphatase RsbU (regulator of sigma subunit)